MPCAPMAQRAAKQKSWLETVAGSVDIIVWTKRGRSNKTWWTTPNTGIDSTAELRNGFGNLFQFMPGWAQPDSPKPMAFLDRELFLTSHTGLPDQRPVR